MTVDEIARSNRCRLNDPMRIEGCIHYCMELVAQEGHLYQEKEENQRTVLPGKRESTGYPNAKTMHSAKKRGTV